MSGSAPTKAISEATTEIVIRGERGLELFVCLDDAQQNRARFRCTAMMTGDAADQDGSEQFVDFEPHWQRNPERVVARMQAMADDPAATQGFSWLESPLWPRASAARDPLLVFVYTAFFRAWQVADLALHRLESQLGADLGALPLEPARIAAAVAPAFDFNRLAHGVALARTIEPILRARIAQPAFRDDKAGATGYALRMLGDLCLRAGNAEQALTCYETAIAAGDNPYRRRKAIEAAQASGDPARVAAHLQAYGARWPLPEDLAALKAGPQPEAPA